MRVPHLNFCRCKARPGARSECRGGRRGSGATGPGLEELAGSGGDRWAGSMPPPPSQRPIPVTAVVRRPAPRGQAAVPGPLPALPSPLPPRPGSPLIPSPLLPAPRHLPPVRDRPRRPFPDPFPLLPQPGAGIRISPKPLVATKSNYRLRSEGGVRKGGGVAGGRSRG